MASKEPKFNPYRPNFWGFLRHLIDKGQFIGLLIAVVVIISVSKMTHDEVATLLENTLEKLESYHILGWVASAILAPLSVVLYRKEKRLNESNVAKLIEEIKKK